MVSFFGIYNCISGHIVDENTVGIFVSQWGGRRIPSNNGDSPAGVTPARSCGKKDSAQ